MQLRQPQGREKAEFRGTVGQVQHVKTHGYSAIEDYLVILSKDVRQSAMRPRPRSGVTRRVTGL